MNEQDITTLIAESLNAHADPDSQDCIIGIEDINAIRTFEENSVMTNNAGLVLHMEDGSEFQITIVQSH